MDTEKYLPSSNIVKLCIGATGSHEKELSQITEGASFEECQKKHQLKCLADIN